MKRTWADIVAVICIVAAVAVFFWPVVGGKLPVPTDTLVGLYHPWRDLYANDYPRGVPYKNFLITDPIRQQIPWRKVAIDQWKSSQLPLWNPYNFSGTNLVGNIQAAVFYPGNILFAFLDFPDAWTVLIVLEPLLAALFLYAYIRHNKLSPLSSLLGSIMWSFSGFVIAWLTWGTMIHVVLWLPLLLLSIDKLANRRILWSVVLVFALSAQLFAGHAQLSLYIVLLSCIYALWRRAKFFWIPFILSLAISSIQWFPLIRSVFESSRVASNDSWQVAGWFLPWQHLAQFLAPDFFGNPATLNYWGEWNYGEFIGYISVVGLIFAFFSFVYWSRSEVIRFWTKALIVALLFLLPTPLAILPYRLGIPILSVLQPTRLMSIVVFSLVVLAVHGFSKWQETRDKRLWLPVVFVGSVLGILWVITFKANLLISQRNLILPTAVYGLSVAVIAVTSLSQKKSLRAFSGIILVAIVAFDLIRFGWKFTPFTPKEYFFPLTSTIRYLQEQRKPFRVASLDPRLLPPNVGAYFGIESIDGYDPIISDRYESFMAALSRGRADISKPYGFNRIVATERFNSTLFRLLNVRYVLSLKNLNDPLLTLVHQEGETRVYELTDPLSQVYFVKTIIRVDSAQQAIETLFDPSFNPRRMAVVENFAETFSLDPHNPPGTSEYMTIDSRKRDGLEIVTDAEVNRFLVITNAYDPSWKVYIDGVRTPISRVNYVLFGFAVPAGLHRVIVQYQPDRLL